MGARPPSIQGGLEALASVYEQVDAVIDPIPDLLLMHVQWLCQD